MAGPIAWIWMTSAPHHGKGDCDSQGGVDKSCLKAKCRDPATFGVDDGDKTNISAPMLADIAERIADIITLEAVILDRGQAALRFVNEEEPNRHEQAG